MKVDSKIGCKVGCKVGGDFSRREHAQTAWLQAISCVCSDTGQVGAYSCGGIGDWVEPVEGLRPVACPPVGVG